MSFKRRPDIFILFLLTAIIASVLMLWVTENGPGVSADSTNYAFTAVNLAMGKGFIIGNKPVTLFPPGYPLFLSVPTRILNNNVLLAGRWSSALLFGITIVMLGLIVGQMTRFRPTALIMVMLVFLLSAPIIEIYSMLWTEVLFVPLVLAVCWLTIRYSENPKARFLLLAAVMSGYAIITRLVGIALLPPVLFVLLRLSEQPMKQRIRDSTIFLGISLLPAFFWFLRNIWIAQALTGRPFYVRFLACDHIRAILKTFFTYMFPVSTSELFQIVFMLAFFVIIFLMNFFLINKYRPRSDINRPRLACLWFAVIFFIVYIATVILAKLLWEAGIHFDTRILLPAWLALLIIIFLSFAFFADSFSQPWIWKSCLILMLMSVVLNARPAIFVSKDIHQKGRGYTSTAWQHSEIISFLPHLSDTKLIYTNAPDIMRFFAGKNAKLLPFRYYPASQKNNLDYIVQLRQICTKCQKGECIVVFIDYVNRYYLPSNKELESACRLPVLKKFSDGIIYAKQ